MDRKSTLVCLAQPLTFDPSFEAGSVERWFQIAPFGHYFMPDGRQFDFNAQSLNDIKSVFDRYKTPISLDYDHQTVDAGKKNGPIETAGFVLALDLRSDGLWGKGKFTPHAIELIQNGSYAFCSPVIETNVTDRLTGKINPMELWNVALTVNPFQDGLAPIVLSKGNPMYNEKKPDEKPTEQPPAKPAAESNGQPPAQEQPPEKQADPNGQPPAEAAKPASGQPAPEANAQQSNGADSAAILGLLAEGVGVDPKTLVDLIQNRLDKVVAVLKGDNVEQLCNDGVRKMTKDLQVKDDQILALSKRVETLEAEKAEREKAAAEAAKLVLTNKVNTRVEELLKTGYLLPEQKADAVEIYTADYERGERLFSKIKVAPIGNPQAKTDPKTVIPQIDKLSKEQLDAVSLLKNIKIHGKPLYRDEAAIVASVAEMNK